jgi:hypothetical protein
MRQQTQVNAKKQLTNKHRLLLHYRLENIPSRVNIPGAVQTQQAPVLLPWPPWPCCRLLLLLQSSGPLPSQQHPADHKHRHVQDSHRICERIIHGEDAAVA